MTPTQLRNSILQTAITGALVPQNPDEGSADALISQIEDEKRRLIAERNAAKIAAARAAGKSDAEIKKLKLEKYTAPKPVNPEDAPFEISESWRWVRIGDIFYHTSGKQQSSSNNKNGSPQKFITTSNLYWGRFVLDNVKVMNFTDEEIKNCSATKGDLLVCEGGAGYGRSAIWNKDYDICLQNHIHRLRPCVTGICEYVFYYIYLLKETNQLNSVGTAMPGLSANRLKELLLPLPPLSEQRRIVSKLEELLPLVDEYGESQTELEALNAALPDKLKKSLLQQAITGRLVPQTESDGSAEQLLLQIEDEKRRLIAERNAAKIAAARAAGKSDAEIKKLKLEKYTAPTPVNPEDAPFEIPSSWRWVRLGDVCEFLSRGKSPKYSDVKKYPVFAQKCNLKEGGISLEKALFLDPDTLSKWSNDYKLRNGDVLINSTGTGTVCRTRLFYESCLGNYPFVVPDSHVSVVRTFQCIDSPFVCYYIMSFSTQKFLEDNLSGSTNQKELSIGVLQNLLIPLPPLSEQRRIVAKLEEMFLEIEKLGNQE